MIAVRRHTDVWLVRHTQTDWNHERRYQSRSDRPLTAFGEARAEAIAQRLHVLHFAAIISSNLTRTDHFRDRHREHAGARAGDRAAVGRTAGIGRLADHPPAGAAHDVDAWQTDGRHLRRAGRVKGEVATLGALAQHVVL